MRKSKLDPYIRKIEREAVGTIRHIKKHSKDTADRIYGLESHLVATMMNWRFVLDEVIELRKLTLAARSKRKGKGVKG